MKVKLYSPDQSEKKIIYDTNEMVAFLYELDGTLELIPMIEVDEITGTEDCCHAYCDGRKLFVTVDFVRMIDHYYNGYLELKEY